MSTVPTRRRFFGLLAAVPFVGAALVPAAAAPDQCHDDRRPDFCGCPRCLAERVRQSRGEPNLLLARAVLATGALRAALSRLIGECEEGDDLWADADGLLWVMDYGSTVLESELLHPDWFAAAEKAARKPSPHPAPLACALAMYDALDALLALGAGHCEHWHCCVCTDADGLVHHVRAGLDLIGGASPGLRPALERELLTEERKAAILAGGGGLMPHTERECHGAVEHAAFLRRMLAECHGAVEHAAFLRRMLAECHGAK